MANSFGSVSRFELERSLRSCGISEEGVRVLISAVRPSLVLRQVEEGTTFSKIGGTPDLPPGVAWPYRSGKPLARQPRKRTLLDKLLRRKPPLPYEEWLAQFQSKDQPLNFIAQISFSEIASVAGDGYDLPTNGALYFFYDDVSQGWGFDPKDREGFKVIFAPEMEHRKPADPPHFEDDVPTYSEVLLRAETCFDLPPSEGIHFDGLSLSPEDRGIYEDNFLDLVEKFDREFEAIEEHKLRGWPDAIQNPMEEECALVTAGINCGEPAGYKTEFAKEVLAQENDWELLLQVASDDAVGMMWGDLGILYLWIRKSDLLRQDFNNTWLILQCT